ncbi:hypothetical protein CRG98_016416 [Punica granatum]|uniref:Uncharacterized protein n=1 Tax=Punica granatum TaxID=22663 RepID=A0A2I0K3U7_PUNGR|nr:hypothetical protein CRG98_016416 [Punica granatum]
MRVQKGRLIKQSLKCKGSIKGPKAIRPNQEIEVLGGHAPPLSHTAFALSGTPPVKLRSSTAAGDDQTRNHGQWRIGPAMSRPRDSQTGLESRERKGAEPRQEKAKAMAWGEAIARRYIWRGPHTRTETEIRPRMRPAKAGRAGGEEREADGSGEGKQKERSVCMQQMANTVDTVIMISKS